MSTRRALILAVALIVLGLGLCWAFHIPWTCAVAPQPGELRPPC